MFHKICKKIVLHGISSGTIPNEQSNEYIYGMNMSLPLLDRVSEHVGRRICTFKGREIKLRISGAVSETSVRSLFLLEDVISEILSVILEVINLKYGKNKQ